MIKKLVQFSATLTAGFWSYLSLHKPVCTICSKTSVSVWDICSPTQSHMNAVWDIGILGELYIKGKCKVFWLLFMVFFLSSTNFIPPTVKIQNLNNYPNSHSLTMTKKNLYKISTTGFVYETFN